METDTLKKKKIKIISKRHYHDTTAENCSDWQAPNFLPVFWHKIQDFGKALRQIIIFIF